MKELGFGSGAEGSRAGGWVNPWSLSRTHHCLLPNAEPVYHSVAVKYPWIPQQGP